MYKEYVDLDTQGRVEFTVEDFDALQNYYIKKVIRHTHPVVSAEHVKISEMGEMSNPVGLSTPTESGKVWTWQSHVDLPHSPLTKAGQLLARGWTVPIRARFVITTPIYDTSSNVPFPTYNMSNITIDKEISSSNQLTTVPTNRHHPSTYTNYRHYLWLLPMNGVCQIHPAHLPIINNAQGALVFAKTPLYIDPANTDFLKEIVEPKGAPNFRALTYIPDYSEEKVWSLTDDSTCWMAGYKTVVAQDHKNIMLQFNDYYNEFMQVLSILNYEEAYRKYFFRLEKAPGNLSTRMYDKVTNLTRLMEAKKLDILDVPEYSNLIFDSIRKKISPYYTKEYNFEVDSNSPRLKDTLFDSCVEKAGNKIKFYSRGLESFATFNGATEFSKPLNIPSYFSGGTRQCMVLTGELGASERSFKKLNKGRVVLVYQIVDGYVSVPYEIYSYGSKVAQDTQNDALTGQSVKRDISEVTKMGQSAQSLTTCE